MPTTLPNSYPVTRTETTLSTNVIDTSPEHKKHVQAAYFKIRVEISAAMIDRLVHHAEVVALKGDSYRLKDRDLGRVPAAGTTEE